MTATNEKDLSAVQRAEASSPNPTKEQGTSMTNPTPQTDTAEKTLSRKPITFHKVIRDTDTARHGLCGAVIPKARAIGAKTTNGVDRVYCHHCASLETLDKQFNKEMQQELHRLERYEAMLDALRWLQGQEDQR